MKPIIVGAILLVIVLAGLVALTYDGGESSSPAPRSQPRESFNLN